MTILLDVRDLSLHYADRSGPVRAVDHISFALETRKTALGVVGESGSGKSSLALSLMRMLPTNVARYEGEIWLEGQELMSMADNRFRQEVLWRKLALVPQGAQNGFNPVLRVGEQIIEPLLVGRHTNKRKARARAMELLEYVGLPPEVYSRYPHELSGGMKQRAMIAAALILQPPLVILDEPTSALDASIQTQITNLLKQLKRDMDLSIIFITHDIALASDVCDSLAVVYAGQIVEIGSAEHVLLRPSHPYTQRLLASIPRLHTDTLPQFIPGAPPDLRKPAIGCRFHPRCHHFMENLCELDPPPNFETEPHHFASCWLYHTNDQ